MAEILLVANYRLDKQQSMLRVADLLEKGLRSNGIDVVVARPECFFGRFAQRWFWLNKWLGYLDKFILFPPRLIAGARDSLLVHIVDHSNAIYCLWLKKKISVVTCNDLLAVRSAQGEFHQHKTGVLGRLFQALVLTGLRRATHLACISESTRVDVLRLTGRRDRNVSRIYLGVAPIFGAAMAPDQPPAARQKYILHVGGETWYKNRQGVLLIYQAIRSQLGNDSPDLVMVGPPLTTGIEGVKFIPLVTDHELAELYRQAEILLFPSLYEGFGWPIIEAQACGCRAVITGTPPLTEAGGEAAARISDPEDIEKAAEQVIKVLHEDSVARQARVAAGRLHAKAFSSDHMIARYLKLYGSILRR